MNDFPVIIYYSDGRVNDTRRLSGDIETQLHQMYDIIGCDYIEIVRLRPDLCLIVDDCGMINDSKINPHASALYGGLIFGTAILAGVRPGDDGDEICAPFDAAFWQRIEKLHNM